MKDRTHTSLPPRVERIYEKLMCQYIRTFENGTPVEIEVPIAQEDVNALASELATNKGYDFTLKIVIRNPMQEGHT